jgi:hypothetical protein
MKDKIVPDEHHILNESKRFRERFLCSFRQSYAFYRMKDGDTRSTALSYVFMIYSQRSHLNRAMVILHSEGWI